MAGALLPAAKGTAMAAIARPSHAAMMNAILRQDLSSFIIRTFATVDGSQEFLPSWHIDLIADVLMRAYRRELKRVIITLPPRSLKSLCASVAFPAWALGRDPSLRFICASYAQDLAGKHARDCRTVMMSPWFRRAFQAAALNPDKMAEEEFECRAGGYRLSTSVGGTLTGRGGNFIIIDDPIKPQDALSEPKRQSVKQWFDSTLFSRLDNKKNDVIILIMQRVHVDDLVAHVLEKENWFHLQLPAIAHADERFVLSDGRRVGRRAGEALHAEREPLRVLEQIRSTMGAFQFSSQYQQSPVPPEGNLVRWQWLKRFSVAPNKETHPGLRIVQSWDLATSSGLHSDWSVCTTWAVARQEYFLIDLVRVRLEFPALKRLIISQKQKFDAQTVLIEEAGVGIGLIQQLKSERQIFPIAIRPDGSKGDRMAANTATLESGRVYIPESAPWLDDLRAELAGFPHGRHDDQADSISQFLTWQIKPRPRAGLF